MIPGKILVFSAASGGGKTTIINKLRSSIPELKYSISCTTRPPRGNEVDGEHYFFIDKASFQKMIIQDDFAEWALVHGNYYGTPRSFIEKNVGMGNHVIMNIDVYGKTIFDHLYPEAIGIFIVAPSLKELERRLRRRNTDSEEQIGVRLINAEKEMAFAEEYGKYEYTVVNDVLEKACSEVVDIVKRVIGKKQ